MTVIGSSKTELSFKLTSKPAGFTLVELIIVVAIIGILAAIVYPSYQGYIERTNRADMMSEMQQVANRIESNKVNYGRYDRIPLAVILSGTLDTDGSVSFPAANTALYTVSVTPNNATTLGSRNWVISAVPIANSRMDGDGTLTLNSVGQKCRASACGMAEEWR